MIFSQTSSLRRTKAVLPAALAALAIGFGAYQIRAQETGAETPAPAHAEPEAKKPKPKPRVRQTEAAAATPAGDGAPVLRSAGTKRICVVDRAAVDQQSTINIASNKRLQDLRATAQAQVDDASKKVEAQLQGADAELRQRPDDAALKQRRQVLTAQMRTIADQAGLFSREYEATRQGVTNQLHSETMPIVREVASSNGCGVVLARDTIVDPGDSLDISRPVVDRMNAELQFRNFFLVDLTTK